MKWNLTALMITTFASTSVFAASAVDGYKHYKFGMTEAQVRKKEPCSLRRASDVDGLKQLACDDFPFGGSKVEAAFGFFEGELAIVALELRRELFGGVLTGLTEKYGPPSERIEPKDFKRADVPGNALSVPFASGSVVLRIYWEDLEQKAALVYRSPALAEKMAKTGKAKVNDDL